MVAFLIITTCNQAGAALSNEDFAPRQQALRTSANQATVYVVEEGDSLWAIAQRYHTNVDVLMAANNLSENSLLSIGREITVPNSRNKIHRIAAGETMWDIACLEGVSVEQIQELNPGVKPNRLRIGQTLTLPPSNSQKKLPVNVSSRGVARLILNWPLLGKITSYFGWRQSAYHYGLDIAGETGDPILAAAGGVVSFRGWKGNYGRAVILDHPDGRQTLYGHMQRILVDTGEQVERGETIGQVGSTGRSTGPHLHFEIRQDGTCMNPLNYLR
ncbi:MAG: M23 family metallopeptidase [Syntrophomonadaceae bacterium]|nr:M23 family metallopeptidase [Syntrophomonadaceae bacterium]